MTENERIEEMGLVMCGRESCMTCTHFFNATKCASIVSAKKLYNAGYRKVERGEWIYLEYSMGRYIGKCTVCECEADMTNYCPHCGADMREK